jgi:fatty-acyl-CoA synthase
MGEWPGTSDLPPSIEHGAPLASDPMLAGRPLTLGLFLHEVATRHADREAIVTPKERMTYGALRDRSLSIARGLVASGAGKGTKVAILLPNSPEWVAAFFGITLIGGIAVALNTFAAGEDLQYMLAQSDSQFVLTSRSLSTHHPMLAPGVVFRRYAELPALVAAFHADEDLLVTMGGNVAPELIDALGRQVTPETDALIMFTSGSTGRPKVVLHMHRAICIASWRWWHLEHRSPIDRVFSTSPFFWSSGLTRTLGGTLAAGAALVLQEHFEPGEALELLESERVTSILSRAHLDHRMLSHPDFEARDLSSVRRIYKGSPLAMRLGFQQSTELEGYGMTETMTLVSCTPEDNSVGEPLSGHLLPGTSVRIVDPVTGSVTPRNAPGRICVRGATLMRCYYNRPLGEYFDADGYFLTSDAGFLDDDGRLHWTGRLDNMAKVAGANVYPIEVERQLAAMEGMLAFSVVSLPHPTLGSALVLCAVPAGAREGGRTSIDESAIREHLRTRLAGYQIPRRILMVDSRELSFTATQKVDVKAIRKLVVERMLVDDLDPDWAAHLRTLLHAGQLPSDE